MKEIMGWGGGRMVWGDGMLRVGDVMDEKGGVGEVGEKYGGKKGDE